MRKDVCRMVSLKKILIIVLLLFVFSCCIKENVVAEYPSLEEGNIEYMYYRGLSRYVDNDFNIVCYTKSDNFMVCFELDK